MDELTQPAMDIVAELREARLRVVSLSSELAQAAYDLALAKARVERGLIKKVGDERKLGHTIEARERVFTLARDADEDYVAALKRHGEVEAALERAKVEVSALSEKLSIMRAAIGKHRGAE